ARDADLLTARRVVGGRQKSRSGPAPAGPRIAEDGAPNHELSESAEITGQRAAERPRAAGRAAGGKDGRNRSRLPARHELPAGSRAPVERDPAARAGAQPRRQDAVAAHEAARLPCRWAAQEAAGPRGVRL